MDYPDRVTRVESGAYRWMSPVERAYFRGQLTLGTKICLVIPFAILLVGAGFGLYYRTWALMPYFGGMTVFLVVLILLIHLGLTRLMGDPWERYEMYDTYVQKGSGQSADFFTFKRAKALVITRKYLELRTGLRRFRIYVPEEDLELVRDFVMERVQAETEMWYE